VAKPARPTVFILWHSRPVGDSETDDKLLGVYSTRQRAEDRAAQATKLPGFRAHPDAFTISEYQLDGDSWTEGFQE